MRTKRKNSDFKHGTAGLPLPHPNSGLPEFGDLMTWPKSETSVFGFGEGWGEGSRTTDSL
jgi:hypothetical protein